MSKIVFVAYLASLASLVGAREVDSVDYKGGYKQVARVSLDHWERALDENEELRAKLASAERAKRAWKQHDERRHERAEEEMREEISELRTGLRRVERKTDENSAEIKAVSGVVSDLQKNQKVLNDQVAELHNGSEGSGGNNVDYYYNNGYNSGDYRYSTGCANRASISAGFGVEFGFGFGYRPRYRSPRYASPRFVPRPCYTPRIPPPCYRPGPPRRGWY